MRPRLRKACPLRDPAKSAPACTLNDSRFCPQPDASTRGSRKWACEALWDKALRGMLSLLA